MNVYEVRPRKDKRGVDLISEVLPFGRLWYTKPDDAIGYAMHNSFDDRDKGIGLKSHVAVVTMGVKILVDYVIRRSNALPVGLKTGCERPDVR